MDGEKKTAKQKLILGTHTSEGEQNYLMIAEVALPTVDNEAEAAQYDEERGEVGGFGAATGRECRSCYACAWGFSPMCSLISVILSLKPRRWTPVSKIALPMGLSCRWAERTCHPYGARLLA